MFSLPNIDVSLLDQHVLRQVRSEYLAQQQATTPDVAQSNTNVDQKAEDEDIDLESAKSITPEVLVKLSKLAKETNLLDVLQKMKQEQVMLLSCIETIRLKKCPIYVSFCYKH